MAAFRFIEVEKAHHPVSLLCRVLRVSRSGYYAWAERPPSTRAVEDERLLKRIKRIHQENHGTYGAPRIHAELQDEHESAGRSRVARLMRQHGLVGVHRRKHRKKPSRHPERPVYEDLLERDFTATAPNRLWLADITQHPTDEGWLYLAVVMDAYARKLVGWSFAEHLGAELVVDAVTMATTNRRPEAGLVHHSDHGSQYTSLAFGRHLERAGIVGSMGRVGDALDNAMMESFFATLQTELLDRYSWRTTAQLRSAIFEFVEVFYNRRRRHSSLGYLSPEAFERRYALQQAA